MGSLINADASATEAANAHISYANGQLLIIILYLNSQKFKSHLPACGTDYMSGSF